MSYAHVKAWRKRVKQILFQSFGGKCGCCSYDACPEALEFHHLDPKVKDMGLSDWSSRASFRGIKAEAVKCVMLCANCHREVHAGFRVIPPDVRRFDPQRFEVLRQENQREKQVAASRVRVQTATTRKCGSWTTVDVVALRVAGHPWSHIAKAAGVSPAAVKKRFEKLQALDA